MRKTLLMSALLTLCLVVPRMTTAGSAIFTWNPPSGPLTNLARYTLYYGLSSRNYTTSIVVPRCLGCPSPPAGTVEYHCLAQFQPGITYYFAVTAWNSSGLESGYSNEVSKKMPPVTCPIGNLAVTPLSSATRVDGYDLTFFSKNFGRGIVGAYCTPANFSSWTLDAERSDLNNDGRVDGYDQIILSGNFGKSCP